MNAKRSDKIATGVLYAISGIIVLIWLTKPFLHLPKRIPPYISSV